jgi:hypothetical protein
MPYKIAYISILLFLSSISYLYAQTKESYYMDAYSKIDSMLTGKDSLNFKEAVFLTENAYFDNQLNQETFKQNTSIMCF